MKALVLGAAGQLGTELVRLLGEEAAVTHRQVSITDAQAVDALVEWRRPDVVLNCAAYNAVDRAETEVDLAHAVNATGAANIAMACARHGSRFIHFSTNFVFDGRLDRPYVESDTPGPLGAYARSKLDGERRVLEAMPAALVIRTAGVFGGDGGQSFPEKIAQRVRSGLRPRVVADQFVNPTYTGDLAPAALRLAEDGLEGVVHVVAEGCSGWDEFARVALAELGLDAGVDPISTVELAAPARRPLNGCLASIRVEALRPWREALHEWGQRVKNP
ncbi:MAG TPA: dTDP-4-dehydrorhamnose reductase [Candidatus Dormibacteraeota bacterium]|nr:dTDP-4-dehydrorhamnose reductase [Candidatus Dormibacteraeota bacterium]